MTTTLIVEDGTRVSTANSYATLAYANSYFPATSDWSGYSDSDKTDALATAFQSLELLYGPNYLGAIFPTSVQVALFPRLPFTDNNGRLIRQNVVPDCLLRAQCEIALLYLEGTNVFPIKGTKRNVAEQSVAMDGLKSQVKYLTPVEDETFPGFRKIDLLLKPILRNGSNKFRLSL